MNINKKKRAVIFGAARSGIGASKLLASKNYEVFLCDESAAPPAMKSMPELAASGISCRFGVLDYDILNGAEIFIISPGIPKTHPFVIKAQEKNIQIISELELGALNIKAQIAAITGTNGKTTVTTLINKIFLDAGIKSLAAGNIGYAICEAALQKESQMVNAILSIEASSFQLEGIETFHPHIAIITNITPDHMDRYNTFDDYKNAKFDIIKNMTAFDFLILNAKCETSRELKGKTKPPIYWFSSEHPVKQGAYFEDGKLWICSNEKIFLMDSSDIQIKGIHNIENILCASLACFLAGVAPETIGESVKSFTGVEHRIEFCGESNGVRFYNDSKATNLDSLKMGLSAFEEPIVLIAGGRSKETTYSELNGLVKKHVKKIITIGEKAQIIENEWGGIVECVRAENMEDAVEKSFSYAKGGDVVLLSPGHKSYDMYNNYEERGRNFKSLVAVRISK